MGKVDTSDLMMISSRISKARYLVWRRLQTISINCVGYYGTCYTWWRHQMEPFSALLAICAGNSPVTGEFPAQRAVTRSFAVFFDLCLNERLSKQSRGWWFETPSRPLWRQCSDRFTWRTWYECLYSSFSSTFCIENNISILLFTKSARCDDHSGTTPVNKYTWDDPGHISVTFQGRQGVWSYRQQEKASKVRITGPLHGEYNGDRWIPHTKVPVMRKASPC